MLKRGEFEVKIIGYGEKERFFDSLSKALSALFMREVSQLTILGGGISCSFSLWNVSIRRQYEGEFNRLFIHAPVSYLFFYRNIREMSAFTLDVELEEFFSKFVNGIYIYEQKYRRLGPNGLQISCFSTISLDWDKNDPEKILFCIHNYDENEYAWMIDFYHKRDNSRFIPMHGSLIKLEIPFSLN